jgi:TP901 family phage tail tape measure protein
VANQELTFDLVLETNKAVGEVKQMLQKSNAEAGKTGKQAGNNFGNTFKTALLAVTSKISFDFLKNLGLTSFNEFAKLEDGLADVRKTVGLTKEETIDFKKEIMALGRETRTPIEELIRIGAIGGQFGRTKEEIKEFTRNINILAVALGEEFPGGVEEATTQVSKLGTIFKEFKDVNGRPTTDAILNIGNALNLLSADGAATSPVISEFAVKIGSIADVVGLSASQVLGFSSALQELAVEPERGASAVTRILQLIARSPADFAKVVGMSTEEFTNIVNTDINKAFMLVSKSVAGSDSKATEFSNTLKDLGLNGVYNTEVIAKLGQNTDLLTKRQEQATEALKNTDSITEEYDIKNENAAATMGKLKNRITEAKESFGNALAPAIVDVVDKLTPLIEGFIGLVNSNPELVSQIFILTGAFIGILTVISGFMTVAGILAPVIASLGSIFGVVGASAGGLAGAGATLSAVFAVLTGPVGLVIAGIALLTAGIIWAYHNVEGFRNMVNTAFKKIVDYVMWAKDNWLEALGQIIGFFITLPFKMTGYVSQAVNAIIDFLRRVDWGGVWNGMLEAFKSMWNSLRNWFSDNWRSLGNGFVDFIKGLLRGMASGIPGADLIINPLINKLPRFATGGEFMVGGKGGVDKNLVQFMATRGEKVIVQTPSQQTDNRQINSGNTKQYIYQEQYKEPNFSNLAYNY